MSELSPRHDLDAAIDRVAARMVAVPEDTSLLARTIERLPERQATPWFMTVRVQMAAAAAVLLVAFVFARPSPEPASTDAARVAVASLATPAAPDSRTPDPETRNPEAAPVARAVASRFPTPGSRLPVERREDHEHSLAPVAAIDALELVEIAPLTMELDATPAPAPLVLPELALDTKGDS